MKMRRGRGVATPSPPSPPLKPTGPASFCSEAPPQLAEATVAPLAFVISYTDFCSLIIFSVFEFVLVCCCVLGLDGVTNCIHSYDVLTRKWTRSSFLFPLFLVVSVEFCLCIFAIEVSIW